VVPILISLSVTPGPYFFCANAGFVATRASAAMIAACAKGFLQAIQVLPFLNGEAGVTFMVLVS
jgi:hypothetical protein